MKNGCKAAFWLRKVLGKDEVRVEYSWWHTGHKTGTQADMSTSMLTKCMKVWINDRIGEGMTYESIKPLLRPTNTALASVRVHIADEAAAAAQSP